MHDLDRFWTPWYSHPLDFLAADSPLTAKRVLYTCHLADHAQEEC